MTFTVLNTRPSHQSQALSELVAKEGMHVINCPTLEIKFNYQALSSQLKPNLANNPTGFDKVIFISRNAVQGFTNQQNYQDFAALFAKADFYAIGKATQLAGQEAGLALNTLSLECFDSEHFLAHPSMQDLQGQKILLVKGENGRDLLANTLQARGADLTELEVYKRCSAKIASQDWQAFITAQSPVLLITSLASWQALLESLDKLYQLNLQSQLGFEHKLLQQDFWQKIKAIVVMSERIANQIEQQGWQGPTKIVVTQTNQGIMDTLANI